MQEETSQTPWSAIANSGWFQIFKTSRQALQPGKVFLAAAGLALTFVVGTALDRIWVGVGWGISAADAPGLPLAIALDPADTADRGVFASFLEHEKHCLDQALKAGRKFMLTGRTGEIWGQLNTGGPQVMPTVGKGYGMAAFVIAMGRGLLWLVQGHVVYAVIFGLLALAIWSIFGGAICRMSALRFARNERISLGEAVGFSRNKFLEFFLAPLIPLIIVLFIGLLMLVGGWVTYVPVIGGLLFGLVLLGGLVMALTLTGLLGGCSLMWPTVAVEGLDCTDALSRSFSYFFEPLERTVIYALTAIVYGALVWLVVKFVAFLLAFGTYGFVGVTYGPLEHMWMPPTYDRLYEVPASAQELGGWTRYTVFPFVRTWIAVGGFLLYGYLISYYYTGSTIIYFLLRQRVDDNELDDVFTETAEAVATEPPPLEPAAEEQPAESKP